MSVMEQSGELAESGGEERVRAEILGFWTLVLQYSETDFNKKEESATFIVEWR